MSIMDRELLEKSATSVLPGWEWNGVNQCIEYIPLDGTYYRKWRPLDYDSDALQLAVELRLDIHPKGNGVEVWHFESRKSSGIVDYGNDPYAATRRAIVIVAAQIGSMK